MQFFLTLLSDIAFPSLPTPLGWAAWLLLLGVLVYALWVWKPYRFAWRRIHWVIFLVLLFLVPFANLFLGIRLTWIPSRPLPGLPAGAAGSALMVFSALPWIVGGGLLGPLGAALLGGLAGLLRGVWDFYSIFPLLEFALLGAWFSANMRQRYRTPVYRWLRQPLFAALLLVPVHVLFYLVGALFTQWSVQGFVPVTARLDLALSNAPLVALVFGAEMLVAGLLAQVLAMTVPSLWGNDQPLQPSPAERSLQSRFVLGAGAFILLILLALLVGDWMVAGRVARDMLRDRLAVAAESTAESVPVFFETGQTLAQQAAADPDMAAATGDALTSVLAQRIQTVPYFDQMLVIGLNDSSLLGGYPAADTAAFRLYPEEQSALLLASGGVQSQVYSIAPSSADEPARVIFMELIPQSQRVLIGRTTLATNPMMSLLVEGMDRMRDLGGGGILLDENGRVIHASQGAQITALQSAAGVSEPLFYDETAADGTRHLVYLQPVDGHPWVVALAVPASQSQQIALDIALPLSVMIISLALVAMALLRVGLGVVTRSLQGLASEANRIAGGDLTHPLPAKGEDEVGQLRSAFEQMRSSLQARLGEINSLLRVSQGVASSLEVQESLRPVLDAVLGMGANSASILLSPAIFPDSYMTFPTRFAAGPMHDAYILLDAQILELAQRRGRIVMEDSARSVEIYLDPDHAQPSALAAVALRHENRYLGVMWAAFNSPRKFPESEMRFLATLAGQAALAISNARLYQNVEAGRRQLEAVLNSTPDPVLVTDHRSRLLLANRAAAAALGQGVQQGGGQETQKVVKLKPLLSLLEDASEGNRSAEILLEDGRTYLATASTVMADGRSIGRVCIMRDVTRFKELDAMKSEFVATVSHDLRSPLTLISGYVTMLEMGGGLTPKQQDYARKIAAGVDGMTRLVNNLLDLGRLEIGVALRLEPVDVLDMTTQVVGSLQGQAAQKNITLSVELPANVSITIEADQALLRQAFYNLAENAIKYTGEGGTVAVRVVQKDKDLVYSVADSGIGIPAEDLPHLFEKFYRSRQREARAQHGTGLGLAIVQSVAVNHGGRVWVESVLGSGSIFHLQIPLSRPRPA